MPFIPPNAKWYLADIVIEYIIQDEPDRLVHTNLILIRADSPEEAYQKALIVGHAYETIYSNSEGKRVTETFKGLHGLNVIHEELQHGAELAYQKHVGMSDQELAAWIRPKERLNVFRDGKVGTE